ncbi:hypothetical protein [Bacillus sp. 165]|uniref:hypothetical protein n=1 Tax=Bacillus sp. 165 TaxID=1529117 RepID=UPI001ADBC03E|nr:hypothetical protein [Bacillus sp. 165]MBO9128326.1 hypothetical protein [Bacillus sp. 165]
MLVSILVVVLGMIIGCSYYFRSIKQAEVLSFQKASLSQNSFRFLVCSKCGQAQQRRGGYQECCNSRL